MESALYQFLQEMNLNLGALNRSAKEATLQSLITSVESLKTDVLNVSGPNEAIRDVFTATGWGTKVDKLLQNFNVVAKINSLAGPGACTFALTFYGSMTGAWAGEEQVIVTLDQTTLTAFSPGNPWPHVRMKCTALTLDTAQSVEVRWVGAR